MLKGYLFTVNNEYVFIEMFNIDRFFKILAEKGLNLISNGVFYTGVVYVLEEVKTLGYNIYWYLVNCHIPPVKWEAWCNAEPPAFCPSGRILHFVELCNFLKAFPIWQNAQNFSRNSGVFCVTYLIQIIYIPIKICYNYFYKNYWLLYFMWYNNKCKKQRRPDLTKKGFVYYVYHQRAKRMDNRIFKS